MKFLHTMIRVNNLEESLDFFCNKLGLIETRRKDVPEGKFTLIFLAATEDESSAINTRSPEIELTHNWGTENDENFKHHDGNSDPRGFGHIGITVPDVYKACSRFEKKGVEFQKKPDDGNMKGLAFIRDPDGYWIEILSAKGLSSTI